MRFLKRKKGDATSEAEAPIRETKQQAGPSSPPQEDPFPPLIISLPLRQQLIHAMSRHLGDDADPVRRRMFTLHNHEYWEWLYRETCADAGIQSHNVERPKAALADILRRVNNPFVIITALRRSIAWLLEQNPWRLKNEMFIDANPSDYVPTLNSYLERAGVEWRFYGSDFAPSTTTDAEDAFIAPAFQLLVAEGFSGAIDEFSRGMIDYRTGDYKSAVLHALKSMESVLQTICDRFGWETQGNPRVSDLLKIVVKNDLLPFGQDLAYKTLFDTLKHGLPPVRNQTSGHGQGSEPTTVPDHVAQYAMNLVGTNIIFLVRCYQARSPVKTKP